MPDPGEDFVDRTSDEPAPNVGELPLTAFLHSDDSALVRAILRCLRSVEQSEQSYAAFGNAP